MGIFRSDIEKMKGYTPGEQPPPGTEYLKLNTNENPYPPSPRVKEAILEEMERLRLYPEPMADRLRERISEIYQVPAENILAGNGSDELLTMVTRTFADKGDLVVFPTPTYTLYKTLCEIQGARCYQVPFREDFSLNEDFISQKAKIVFIANPNSPSGTVVAEDVLARIASRISGVLVIDEAYVDFARKNCQGLLAKHKNVIILRTLSKSFSLAGLRVGYALAEKTIIENLHKVKDSYNVSRLSIAGGAAALGDIAWMRENMKKIIASRRRLVWGLKELGFSIYPSESNFVLARIEFYPAEQIYRQLKRRKILVRYYDTPVLKDCLRISIGTDQDIKRLIVEIAEITGWKSPQQKVECAKLKEFENIYHSQKRKTEG
ncbi:MAG: histidinol-phosphate transaminase [Candidatus Aureabacteria bacterium]|nr:histidinol-phosphate transaminase [Candidatus Auribacterota bacterium]